MVPLGSVSSVSRPSFPLTRGGTGSAFQTLRQVSTLQEIVVNFVAENADKIESLNDFPSVVGRSIFSKVVKNGSLDGNFRTYGEQLQIWKIFAKAYAPEILPTINMSRKLLVINEYLEHLQLVLPFVTELDVSYCNLGSSHDLIDKLAYMENLHKLSLRKNQLQDVTVRKLTLPIRVFKRGLTSVKELDLSGNEELTDESTRFLCSLKNLKALNLSGTRVTEKGIEMLKIELSLSLCSLSKFKNLAIQSSGWAVPVFERWHKILENRRKQRFSKTGPYGMCRGMKIYVKPRLTETAIQIELPEKQLLFMSAAELENSRMRSPPKKKPMTVKLKSIEKELFPLYAKC